MLKTVKNGDINAAIGANCTRVKEEDVAKKALYAPTTARLIEGDVVEMNVVDENGKLIWGKDSRLNDAYFVLATLKRGNRVLENYHLYPSMLLRAGVEVSQSKHSEDMKEPNWVTNSGLFELLPSQTLVSYMTLYIGYSILTESITPATVWGLDFDKMNKQNKKVADLPKPIIDEWWISTIQKFYTFVLTELTAEEPDNTEAAPAASVAGL